MQHATDVAGQFTHAHPRFDFQGIALFVEKLLSA
jgi:hypothetical protein